MFCLGTWYREKDVGFGIRLEFKLYLCLLLAT